MKEIRVLHCLETIGSGGVEQRRLMVAKNLDKKVYKQYVVCSKAKEVLKTTFENENVTVFQIGPLRHLFNLSYYKKLFQVVRQVKPDIIHGAVFEGVISATIAGFFKRVPIIII